MVYITGDTHGKYGNIKTFCEVHNTTTDDILIILGDTGLNYYTDDRAILLKDDVSTLPITLFCIRGNHEERPANIPTYEIIPFAESEVYIEPEYPNILFAIDGNIYNLGGNKCLCIGGAYSVDKYYRLSVGMKWFRDELLTEDEMEEIESNLLKRNNYKVDYVLTHTSPYDTRPTHLFLPGINQETVDTSMEEWLQHLSDDILTFKRWYFGHYHDNWINGKYEMLYKDIIRLGDT